MYMENSHFVPEDYDANLKRSYSGTYGVHLSLRNDVQIKVHEAFSTFTYTATFLLYLWNWCIPQSWQQDGPCIWHHHCSSFSIAFFHITANVHWLLAMHVVKNEHIASSPAVGCFG